MNVWRYCIIGLMACATGAQAADCTPAKPAKLEVRTGIPGRPPSFIYSTWPAGAKRIQIEVSIRRSNGEYDPIARPWIDSTTSYLNSITNNGVKKTEVFLRGTSATGFMMFYEEGIYGVRWRGYNDCGYNSISYGPYSDYTTFKRVSTSATKTYIVSGPSRVGSSTDVTFVWTNDFASEVYSAQILYGGRAVRNVYGRGTFRAGWMYEGLYSYSDRPASPTDELPNGSFTFRVRAWSPMKQIWSPWKSNAFVVARGYPCAPSLAFSQSDFNGFFPWSPRPRFITRYGTGRIPALWTYYDICRLDNGRLCPVMQKWVSRYTSAVTGAGRAGSGEISLRGEKIFTDLGPGTYVWRVKAHNGHTQWWDGSRKTNLAYWTSFRTNIVVAAGTLPVPSTNGMTLGNSNVCYDGVWYATSRGPEYLAWSNGQTRVEGKIGWDAVPNAFVYNVKIYRNNAWYKTYSGIDPRYQPCVLSPTGRSFLFTREPFPAGTYYFQVQAINRANTPSKRLSPWSPPSRPFVIR